jgi:hypothetical protein
MSWLQEMIDKSQTKNPIVSTLVKDGVYWIDNGIGKVPAVLMESPKQGRGYKKTVLMNVKGSHVGLFDEMGSVYVADIIEPVEEDEL